MVTCGKNQSNLTINYCAAKNLKSPSVPGYYAKKEIVPHARTNNKNDRGVDVVELNIIFFGAVNRFLLPCS